MKNFNELQISENFDQMVEELTINYYSAGFLDRPMVSEDFNNWLDSLHSDGIVSDEQVNNFCYVGVHR